MAQVRVRNKHQITIPARIAESANIKPDDLLDITYKNGVVTLIPISHKTKKQSALSYAGIAKGTWGKTTAEINSALENNRDSWER
ncbi:MAG: AbrB/MazE/SpoVT family DNA-binding domain-containing protein [Chlorobiaceae bacterium]|nr:AbrB/MazE/SpoVT family DNA-binding domain-containing protein [Chlorobiaceae bacterium]